MDWIIAVAALFHIVASPFTKVEESFNVQACHDILYHGVFLNKYDHLEYPGVVPRTFIGPLVVSFISLPVVTIFRVLGLSKFYSQYVVRFVLGSLVILAWRHLRLQVQRCFGKSLAIWFTFITASQFHFIYYLSHPLPNIFALIFTLLSFSFWLQQRHRLLIFSCGIGVFIFRSELCLLLGPLIFHDLIKQRIHVVQFLKYGIPIGLLCLGSTIFIDSLFWLRLTWPEGEVFWFNTYKNESHHWGVYPFLWYWYSCLPRALGFSLPLVPVGVAIDPRVRTLVAPGLLYIGLYSFLPHKELRFIIYIFPLLNIAAARACQFFWGSRMKSPTRKFLAIGSALHILGNLVFSSLLLTISSSNYPGGAAIQRFHQVVPPTESIHLHIGNLAAQTGVTRFTELHSHWRYNKTENLKAGGKEIRAFTHLLVEAKSKYAYNLKHYTMSHRILDSIDAFSHLSFNYLAFPPIKVRVKPAIFLLENFVKEDIDWSFVSPEKEGKEITQTPVINSVASIEFEGNERNFTSTRSDTEDPVEKKEVNSRRDHFENKSRESFEKNQGKKKANPKPNQKNVGNEDSKVSSAKKKQSNIPSKIKLDLESQEVLLQNSNMENKNDVG